MNDAQAKAAMRKLWGTKAAWRYNDRALKGEERQAVKATLPDLMAAQKAAIEARDARRAELLRDPEYQRLREAAVAAEKAHAEARSNYHARRVTIGRTNGIFFTVEAEGDNWQEAIDIARAKRNPNQSA